MQARPEDIQVFVAEKALLETLTGFSMYQGLLAVGKVPPLPTLAEVVARSPQPRLLAAADGLCNAENLGALVRNCAAFNAQALIVGETCSSPFLRRAVRSSMGAIFQLPIVETASLTQALRDLRERGIRCIAAHPHADGRTLSQANFAGDCCIVFGSEGYGISPAVLAPATKPRPSPCRRRWTPSTSAAPPPCSSTKPTASAAECRPRPLLSPG